MVILPKFFIKTLSFPHFCSRSRFFGLDRREIILFRYLRKKPSISPLWKKKTKRISALVFLWVRGSNFYELIYLFLLFALLELGLPKDFAPCFFGESFFDIFSASRRILSASSPKILSNLVLFFLPDAAVFVP